jgi:PAS domain S-box-containing protein
MSPEDLIRDIQRIYKDLPVGLCCLDTDLRYFHVNEWLARINGIPVEEHLGHTTRELIPQVADGVEDQFRQVIESGEPIIAGSVVAETPSQPGVIRHFEHSYYPINSDDGQVIGISCIIQDVTDRSAALEALQQSRKELEQRVEERTAELQRINDNLNKEIEQRIQVENALRTSEAALANILDISADAIISIDENQHIRLFNQGAQQIFGYTPGELIGKPLEILLPEQNRIAHKRYVTEYSQSSEPSRLMNQRANVQGQRKDGTRFPASASISRMTLQDKTTLTVYLRDISEFRALEAATQRQRDELDHVNRIGIMGEVSTSLAHELNQPLASLLINAQVLNRLCQTGSPFPEDGKEIISDLISDAKRAGEVIQQLKSLLKPGELQRDSLDVNQIIVEVEHLLKSELLFNQIKPTIELAPDLPAVTGVRIHLQQVLLNLIVNALDAMKGVDEDNRRLLILTRYANPTEVEICVRDSGIGIQDSAKQVFEPYYTTKEGGMGMGLAISSTIVDNHGGRLWAENNKEGGASFYVTMPVASTEAVAESSSKHEHKNRKEEPGKATVFIVDDDPLFLKALRRLIESAGYLVEVFTSADAFLRRENYAGYGCLLTDLHMPEKTGSELQIELSNREYTMPIIFITGAGDTSSGVTAIKHGAVDYLEKPIDSEKLLEIIARAIKIDLQARNHYSQHKTAKEKIATLTPREAEVMELVVKGRLNKQIAHTLGIREATVKVHRSRVMQKLEVLSLAELIHVSGFVADTE